MPPRTNAAPATRPRPTAGARVVRQNPTKREPTGTIEDIIEDLDFPENSAGIKCLVYGDSGTGKTRLWGSFPGPTLAVVVSGGKASGELRSINTPEHKAKVKQARITHSEQIRELIDLQKQTGRFRTLVIDHISGLQDRILAEILGLEELPPQKSWGMAKQEQYGQCALQVKEICRAFLSFDANVVIVGQQRENKPENDPTGLMLPTTGVGTLPSIAGWLNPACDYVAQTFKRQRVVKKMMDFAGQKVETEEPTDKVDYCLRIGPHPVITTKFRVPPGVDLPDAIVNPSYDKLLAVINGEYDPAAG